MILKFGALYWRLNDSFITLIPKKEDSCTPKDFGPLNLIGSAYKIISEVLSERLKSVMPLLISDYQWDFINNIKILDGVLIANECVDSRVKSKKPEILSKLMNDGVERGQIQGFRVADTGTMISHLQFADDNIIFLNATSSDEVTRLFIILSIFKALTGMKMNLKKSIMVSIGVDEVIVVLAKELGAK
ncbi:uncharacterized protein LOC113352412 [Papaver somniferum]|uniref:uncharacterized protein LOC113352412 n=1 Tax=Papaver somniferum TaxID=3469 RepID=UPI000E6F8CA7|nr:uncharacterized protein LOC113352412 [Papaver somniferum]